MTNENLLEIIKIQSEVIDKIGQRVLTDLPPTPERSELVELLKTLKNKLKDVE